MEKKIIEEVIIKKKKEGINKEKLSERIKNELLNKKKRRDRTHEYISAQSLVKNYREKQKSFSHYKRRVVHTEKLADKNYDATHEHQPIILIRICGQWSRIPKEIQSILTKLNLIQNRYHFPRPESRQLRPRLAGSLIRKQMDIIYSGQLLNTAIIIR